MTPIKLLCRFASFPTKVYVKLCFYGLTQECYLYTHRPNLFTDVIRDTVQIT